MLRYDAEKVIIKCTQCGHTQPIAIGNCIKCECGKMALYFSVLIYLSVVSGRMDKKSNADKQTNKTASILGSEQRFDVKRATNSSAQI